MKGCLKIVTKDLFLGQKLKWELCEDFETVEISEEPSGTADVWLLDTRAGISIPAAENIFYLCEENKEKYPPENCLPLPLPLGLAKKRLQGTEAAPLILFKKTQTASLYGTQIRFTEVEFSLLHALMEANGAFVSREALRTAVWGKEGSESLLNVYIHYLREKLEQGGEKIILSSRKSGYALAEKFARRKSEC